MNTFWRLGKRDHYSAALQIMKILPELNMTDVDSETITNRLRHCTDIEFYYKEKAPVKFWVRLTLPAALTVMFALLLLTPINFMATGRWGYKWLWLKNWLTKLRLT